MQQERRSYLRNSRKPTGEQHLYPGWLGRSIRTGPMTDVLMAIIKLVTMGNAR